MLGFVVPFRSKSSSANWAYHSQLLKRTIGSICNQSNRNFKVVVVYTDLPLDFEEFNNENITFLQFPYSIEKVSDIADWETDVCQFLDSKKAPLVMDKCKRQMYGARELRRQGCKYIMAVDADDLISNKLCEFVANNNGGCNHPGWYVNKGYCYEEPLKYFVKVKDNMQYVHGSTYILRTDLVPIPEDFESKRYCDYGFLGGHSWLLKGLALYSKVALEPLPFYASIYVLYRQSLSQNFFPMRKNSLKRMARKILRYKSIDKNVISEFAFYRIDLA